MDYKKIGLRIKLKRVEKNMTLVELAGLAKMSVTTISHIENGTSKARLLTLKRIADLLEMDFKELVEVNE